jgi:hypothetical protein
MGGVKVDRRKAEVLVGRVGGRALDEKAQDLLRLSQEECPVQSGRLLRSHHIVRGIAGGRRIVAGAPYARAVFDGAQGRRPNRWFLRAIDRARI